MKFNESIIKHFVSLMKMRKSKGIVLDLCSVVRKEHPNITHTEFDDLISKMRSAYIKSVPKGNLYELQLGDFGEMERSWKDIKPVHEVTIKKSIQMEELAEKRKHVNAYVKLYGTASGKRDNFTEYCDVFRNESRIELTPQLLIQWVKDMTNVNIEPAHRGRKPGSKNKPKQPKPVSEVTKVIEEPKVEVKETEDMKSIFAYDGISDDALRSVVSDLQRMNAKKFAQKFNVSKSVAASAIGSLKSGRVSASVLLKDITRLKEFFDRWALTQAINEHFKGVVGIPKDKDDMDRLNYLSKIIDDLKELERTQFVDKYSVNKAVVIRANKLLNRTQFYYNNNKTVDRMEAFLRNAGLGNLVDKVEAKTETKVEVKTPIPTNKPTDFGVGPKVEHKDEISIERAVNAPNSIDVIPVPKLDKIVEALKAGETPRKISKRLNVDKATVLMVKFKLASGNVFPTAKSTKVEVEPEVEVKTEVKTEVGTEPKESKVEVEGKTKTKRGRIDLDKVKKFLDEGKSISEISSELGFHIHSICNACIRAGIEYTDRRRKHSESEIDKMIEEYKNGKPMVVVAKEFHVAPGTLTGIIAAAGVQIRKGACSHMKNATKTEVQESEVKLEVPVTENVTETKVEQPKVSAVEVKLDELIEATKNEILGLIQSGDFDSVKLTELKTKLNTLELVKKV